MLKRELKFRTYLLPLVMVSFLPSMSYAVDPAPAAPAVTKDQLQLLTALSGQSITVAGKTFKLTEVADAAPAATPANNPQQPPAPVPAAAAPAQEVQGMLNASDLSSAGVRMSIQVTGKTATLQGWVAPECASDIEVATTGSDYPLLYSENNGVKSVGFAIRNTTGTFLACMKKPANNCAVLKGCISLSSMTAPYQIDGKDHINLAYIDAKSGDPQATKITVIGKSDWPSNDEQAAADAAAKRQRDADYASKRAAAAKANATNLANCVKTAKTEDDLAQIRALVTPEYLSDSDVTKIGNLLLKQEDALEKAKTKQLTDGIAALLKTSKTGTGLVVKGKKKKKDDDDDDVSTDEIADRIGKLEDKVYDYAGQLDEFKENGQMDEKEYQKQEDILATAIQNLIKLKLKDDQSPESFDKAREMLARALGDSDDEDGNELHPSDKVVSILEATDKVLVVSKIASEGKTCMEEQARLASYDKSDCDDANADYKKLHDKLQKKETACEKMKKMDKDEKAECKANSNELKLLGDDIAADANEVNTEYTTAVANLQKSRGVGANGMAQQQPNALAAQAGLQNGQFAGSPTAYNPSVGPVQIYGTGNSLGAYPQALPYQQAAMSYPQVGLPYQQQQTGMYNGIYGGYLH